MAKFKILVIALVAFAVPAVSAQNGAAPQSRTSSKPKIAFTFDDIPAHGPLPPGVTRADVAKEIVTALKAANVPAYGFVNGVRVQEEPASEAALQVWSEAGLPAGNHTWSHKNLNQLSIAEFENEITENEPTLRRWFAERDWHWFRYPFLAEGDTVEKRNAVRDFLAQHGYKIGAVTMSFGDYMWNEPYARCAAKKDDAAIAQLESSYLEAAEDAVHYYRGASQAVNGRDIPYVLLMHLGAFDARMLPRLISLYKKDGFQFVTLEQAERDPFYKSSVDPGNSKGPDSLEVAMAAKHIAAPHHSAPAVDLNSICR